MNGLGSGAVGCLHGGVYNLPGTVTWNGSNATLQSYPGETAQLAGYKFMVSGPGLTIRDFTVRDVANGNDQECVGVEDANDRVEQMRIRNCGPNLAADNPRGSGIILHSAASNAVITRNWVSDVGTPGSTLHHGIYVTSSGHVITNNLFSNIRGGYGIQLYSSPSNVVVAQNTVVGSQTRSGIVIDTSGSNVRVANNIFANNVQFGINYKRCGTGCLVDNNLTWGNTLGNYTGITPTHQILGNPLFADSEYRIGVGSAAIDVARADYSYSPDLDRRPRPQGPAPDLGALER